jgi:hypothetical protein
LAAGAIIQGLFAAQDGQRTVEAACVEFFIKIHVSSFTKLANAKKSRRNLPVLQVDCNDTRNQKNGRYRP